MKISKEGDCTLIELFDGGFYAQRNEPTSPTGDPLAVHEEVIHAMAKEILRLQEIEWQYKSLG